RGGSSGNHRGRSCKLGLASFGLSLLVLHPNAPSGRVHDFAEISARTRNSSRRCRGRGNEGNCGIVRQLTSPAHGGADWNLDGFFGGRLRRGLVTTTALVTCLAGLVTASVPASAQSVTISGDVSPSP